MPTLRWILLLLYVALILALFALGMWPEASWGPPILLSITLTAQATLILGAGQRDLCRPIRRPRLWLPVAAAAFMLAVLVVALAWALAEFFRLEDRPGTAWEPWAVLGASWLAWGVLLFRYTRSSPRYLAVLRLAQWVFVGSLAELLAAVPAHIVVSKRGGCFAGLATGLGICAGLFVMIWSFGPAIFLLFVHEAYQRERSALPAVEPPPPSPAAPFQFSLRALLLGMFATGISCGLLRMVWGLWPAGAFAAAAVLGLLCCLLVGRPRLIVAGLAGLLPGLIWVFWGEWGLLTAVVLPAGAFAILLVNRLTRAE